MLPRNSRLRRLSQAALSRSQFLQLATGALLPFVGLSPPAAAAKNPELAQNSGAPGTKDAAAQGRMGAILVSQFGPVKIHSYLSPLDGFHVNSQMIEGPTAGVLFDGQLLRPYAGRRGSYTRALGEPRQPVILSRAPTDHAFTVVDHFDHWMIVLEQLKALQDYDTITIGHDTPVHRSAIDSTITYVKRAREIHAVSADAKTYSESLKAAFPDRQPASMVDFSAKLLYAARR